MQWQCSVWINVCSFFFQFVLFIITINQINIYIIKYFIYQNILYFNLCLNYDLYKTLHTEQLKPLIMQQNTSSLMVIIGMVNGMIGGVILVLPLLTLNTGTVTTGIIIILSGIFSYYSCMLCVKHLGTFSDLDEAILHHFNKNVFLKVFYDFVVFLNLFLLLILYFQLIVQQWQGIFPSSIVIPICNFLLLIFLVFLMKFYQFGVHLLAYGIISTIGYCIFLIWMLTSSPSGPEKMTKFGYGGVQLAASMSQAFSIQTFFIPVLRKNNNQNNYQIFVLITYIAGLLVYIYIAYAGAFGLLHREPVQDDPQTIVGYFDRGRWQLHVLQIIYLIHLYSAFPEFLLVSCKRFLSIFKVKVSAKYTISKQEVIYALALVAICLIFSLASVQIQDVITINGAVVGFFFIYFLPVITHIKCVYFQPIKKWFHSRKQHSSQQIEITHVDSDGSMKSSLISHRSTIMSEPSSKEMPEVDIEECHCDAKAPGSILAIFDIIILLAMMASGIFVMYGGILKVAQ